MSEAPKTVEERQVEVLQQINQSLQMLRTEMINSRMQLQQIASNVARAGR